jgi:outer membrane protein assembly factor BamB
VPAPIAVGDYLYMVNDMASVITACRAKTGEVLWQERLGEARRESFSAAPVAVDGKVFFTNDSGETFVVRQGPDFALLHVNSLDEGVIASPALVDGVWYWRTAGHLYAIGARR